MTAVWPNSITAVRLLGVPAIGYWLWVRDWSLSLSGVALFGALDVADGFVARRLRQTSRFGAFLDSMTDKTLLIVIFTVLGVTGAVPGWVFLPIAALNINQLGCALLYQLRGVERPKTFLGPFVALSLLACSWLLPSAMQLVVGSAAVLFALNDSYYYTKPLWYGGVVTVARSLPAAVATAATSLASHSMGAVVENYRLKLTRPAGSVQILTLPNVITMTRFVLVPFGTAALCERRFGAAIATGALFIALDVVDGYLARALGQITRAGRVLDGCVDKAGVIGLVCALYCIGSLPVWLLALVVVRVAVVGMVSGLLFVRGLPLPRPFWTFPALVAVGLYASLPSEGSLWVAVAANMQSVINSAHQAASTLRQRG